MLATFRPVKTTTLLLIVLIVGSLYGCGGGGGGDPTYLVLSGRVYHEVAGGPCCNPPVITPLPSTLVTFHLSGGTAEMGRTRTDTQGNYAVTLIAGTYSADLVNRTTGPVYDTVTPQQIPVIANAINNTDITFVEDVP